MASLTHQPGKSDFKSVRPEDVDWKPSPAFPHRRRVSPSLSVSRQSLVRTRSGVPVLRYLPHRMIMRSNCQNLSGKASLVWAISIPIKSLIEASSIATEFWHST